MFVCASALLREEGCAGWRCCVRVSEWTVGAVFIRNVCCLRCGGAHAIATVRASPTKRKEQLGHSALSGGGREVWLLRVLSLHHHISALCLVVRVSARLCAKSWCRAG